MKYGDGGRTERQKNWPNNRISWGKEYGHKAQNIGKQEIVDGKRVKKDEVKTDRMQPQVNQNYTTIINLEKIGKDKNTDGVISQLIRKEEGGGGR